jgi:hypothetical protein
MSRPPHTKKYSFGPFEVTLIATHGNGMQTQWWPPAPGLPLLNAGQAKEFQAIKDDFRAECDQLGIDL